MEEKILIFGAKGTLGRELVREFLKKDYEVQAYDQDEIDVTADDLDDKIKQLRPDIIINATGYNKVDLAETDVVERKTAYAVNAEAPKIMAESARDIGAVLVNYSTDYVFDGKKSGGYTEDDKPNPQSEYGKSKLLGEKNVADVGGKYYIIRPSRIFGQSDGGNNKKSFVEIMLDKAELPEVKVVTDSRGTPTYAPDLADFTLKLIRSGKPYGIYHGANTGTCSWYEFAKEIFKLDGRSPKLIPILSAEYNNPAKRPADSSLINTKIKPQRSWQSALRDYFKNKS